MIHELGGAEGQDRTFVVMPNQSMSWRGMVWMYSVIASVTLLVAVGCYFMGLTLVLPFSGVELLIVGAVFYITACHGDRREVIIIGKETVTVQSGRFQPESHYEFPRQWARVVFEQSSGWYPNRLLIRSHGRQVEIGSFLNEQERNGLAEKLSVVIHRSEHRINPVTLVTNPS